ncbi:MAG: hypothetical protein IPP71_08220 [Bacteroidetes bacterium]|nr:hypothetical protein [Bacteroidota bacterium]
MPDFENDQLNEELQNIRDILIVAYSEKSEAIQNVKKYINEDNVEHLYNYTKHYDKERNIEYYRLEL